MSEVVSLFPKGHDQAMRIKQDMEEGLWRIRYEAEVKRYNKLLKNHGVYMRDLFDTMRERDELKAENEYLTELCRLSLWDRIFNWYYKED